MFRALTHIPIPGVYVGFPQVIRPPTPAHWASARLRSSHEANEPSVHGTPPFSEVAQRYLDGVDSLLNGARVRHGCGHCLFLPLRCSSVSWIAYAANLWQILSDDAARSTEL